MKIRLSLESRIFILWTIILLWGGFSLEIRVSRPIRTMTEIRPASSSRESPCALRSFCNFFFTPHGNRRGQRPAGGGFSPAQARPAKGR